MCHCGTLGLFSGNFSWVAILHIDELANFSPPPRAMWVELAQRLLCFLPRGTYREQSLEQSREEQMGYKP